jgi:hypothetical protein
VEEVAELGKGSGLTILGLLGIGLYIYSKRAPVNAVELAPETHTLVGPQGQTFVTLESGKVIDIIPAPPAPYKEPSEAAQRAETLVWSNDIAGGGWYSELMGTYYKTPYGKYGP